MADWGYFPAVTRFAEDDTALPSYKASATSGAANTKGSWTQYVASAPFDVQGLIMCPQSSSSGNWVLLDIGIGGSGSEQVIVPNIFLGAIGNNNYYYSPMFFPVQIPSGTRIAARCQMTNASITLAIKFQLVAENGCGPFQTGTDYGSVTATSKGTGVVAGGSANTKGAWSQLVASTTGEIIYAVIMTYIEGAASYDVAYDLGIGGAGSEQIILPDVFVGATNSTTQTGMIINTPLRIPAGTRIAARCACTTASVDVDMNLIGFA